MLRKKIVVQMHGHFICTKNEKDAPNNTRIILKNEENVGPIGDSTVAV